MTASMHSDMPTPASVMLRLCRGLCVAGLLTFAGAVAWAGAPRFVPSPAGDEVTDTATGLIWRRCSEGQRWDGTGCAGSATLYTWDGALALALAEAARTGTAWRLPNVKELRSLVDQTQYNPTIDGQAFPNTLSSWTWTSTPKAGFATDAWYVGFFDGYVSNGKRIAYYVVRLVRA